MITGASPSTGKADGAGREAAQGPRLPAAFALGAVIYLALVVSLGVVLRARYVTPVWLGFAFGNLMHAHSHGAYFGWASLGLMAGIYRLLPELTGRALVSPAWVRRQLWLTHAATVGAVIAFAAGGYNPVSIAFSTVNVLLWYMFAALYWRNVRGAPRPWPVPVMYFNAAVGFLVLSSLGTWLITIVTAAGLESPLWRSAGLYLFLSSFADGWLLVGLMGLAAALLPGKPVRETGAWARPSLTWLVLLTPPAFLAYLVPAGAPPVIAGLGLAARAALGVVYGVYLRRAWAAYRGRKVPAGLDRGADTPERDFPTAAARLWGLAAGFLAVKAAVHLASGLAGLLPLAGAVSDLLSDPPRQLFVAYLHADLLGLITCGLLGVLHVLFGRRPTPGGEMAGSAAGKARAATAALAVVPQAARSGALGAAVLGIGVVGMVAALAGAGLAEAGLWPGMTGSGLGPRATTLMAMFKIAFLFSVVSLAGVLGTVLPLGVFSARLGDGQTVGQDGQGDKGCRM